MDHGSLTRTTEIESPWWQAALTSSVPPLSRHESTASRVRVRASIWSSFAPLTLSKTDCAQAARSISLRRRKKLASDSPNSRATTLISLSASPRMEQSSSTKACVASGRVSRAATDTAEFSIENSVRNVVVPFIWARRRPSRNRTASDMSADVTGMSRLRSISSLAQTIFFAGV
jgi:hypothetical protein